MIHDESEDNFMLNLLADGAYDGLDLEAELAAYQNWCLEHVKVATRSGFVKWLARAEPPLRAGRPKKEEPPQVDVYAPPPDNWQRHAPAGYGHWRFEELPVNYRKQILLACLAEQKAKATT